MGKALLIVGVVFVVVALFAVLGESLPEGSTLRGIADSIRTVGRSIGDGFGGGYGELRAG